MAGSVLDVGLQCLREAQDAEDAVGNLLDTLLHSGSEMIGLADGTGLEDSLDPGAMIDATETTET